MKLFKEAIDSAYRGMHSVAKNDIVESKNNFDTAMEYLAIAVDNNDYENISKWPKRAQEFLGEVNTNLTI